MPVRFHTVDVFTDRRFGGNPLAVIPDASGLSTEVMQAIAREFNYSESTFVLPPADPANTRQVRIFTPEEEIPFAGHPNVGTAHVLARTGALGAPDGARIAARFEEKAGLVAVDIEMDGDVPLRSEIVAPQSIETGAEFTPGVIARAVSLEPSDIVTRGHAPVVGSAGLPFVLVELSDLDALGRAAIDMPALLGVAPGDVAVGVHLYTRVAGDDSLDIRARMFAPVHSVPEDPATGSANCALAGLLASLDDGGDGERRYRIGQGFEMGRPSRLELTAIRTGAAVTEIRLAGQCVDVMEGVIEV